MRLWGTSGQRIHALEPMVYLRHAALCHALAFRTCCGDSALARGPRLRQTSVVRCFVGGKEAVGVVFSVFCLPARTPFTEALFASARRGALSADQNIRGHFSLHGRFRRNCHVHLRLLQETDGMNIYRMVQLRVKEEAGYVPKTCWIAHVLELNGQPLRRAHNRKDQKRRQVPCPPDKRPSIERVLRELKKIR